MPKAGPVSQHFLLFLAKQSRLQSLTLAGLVMRAASVANVINCLSCQDTLEVLDISRNEVKYEFATETRQGLPALTALRTLDVAQCVWDSSTLTVIASCFPQLPLLGNLRISGHSVTQDERIEMGQYLSRCKQLHTVLCAGYCSYPILNNLTECSKLKHLEPPAFRQDLGSTRFDIQCKGHLDTMELAAAYLSRLTGLQFIPICLGSSSQKHGLF